MNFYKEAAGILDRLDKKKGSIKGSLSSVNEKDRKRTAALVIETLKYKESLTSIINATPLIKDERRIITSHNLALVLVHDLLLAKGIQAGDGPIKQAILRHKTRLQAELVKLKVKKGVASNAELAQSEDHRAAQIPRYVRINRNLWTMEEAVEAFQREDFILAKDWSTELKKGFVQDAHVPDLLAFHPSVTFHKHPAYQSGKIILQDKASCFPALVLNPPRNACVIDATAAPGNKTSHLSALMRNTGKIFAFERDRRRFGTLQEMLAKAGCKNVTATNADFLQVDPHNERFKDVTHILLDPSCSGSGIVNRLDYLQEPEQDESQDDERLNKLSAFQLLMIKHAMQFPSVTRIVYSTCSVHIQENEDVVQQALESDEAKQRGFVLAPKSDVLPSWERRGDAARSGRPSDSLVRCIPGEDGTNGFFVSCFVTLEKSSSTAIGTNRSGDNLSSTVRKRKNGDGGSPGVTLPKKKRRAAANDQIG